MRIIDKQKIPDLEIYIIITRPSEGAIIQDDDHESVKDRINDITFFDRNSHHDENMFDTVTDHVAMIDKLKDLAKSYITSDRFDELENDFEKFFNNSKE